jgi:hypothetical protein
LREVIRFMWNVQTVVPCVPLDESLLVGVQRIELLQELTVGEARAA